MPARTLLRLLTVLGAALAAVLTLTTGVAQAHIPPSQYHAAGYTESGATRIWMGFHMPAVSCAGMAKDSSVSIGAATAPFDETSIPRFRVYARGFCEHGRAQYILFTEYARFEHQRLGLEFGLKPGDWVALRLKVYGHHVHYWVHQQPDGNGNDLQGTLQGSYGVRRSPLLVGAVAAGPSVPSFGSTDVHVTVDGGRHLADVHPRHGDARRSGRTVIHATGMTDGGRGFGLQFLRH